MRRNENVKFLGDWLFQEALEPFLHWRFRAAAERCTRLALARPGKVARVALRREIAAWASVEPLTIVKATEAQVRPDPGDPERQQFAFTLGARGTGELLLHRASAMEGTRIVRARIVDGGLIFRGSVPRSEAAVISTILASELQLVTDHVRASGAVCAAYNNQLLAKAQAYIDEALTARREERRRSRQVDGNEAGRGG